MQIGYLPVLICKRLLNGHHAVWPGGCLIGWSLLLREVVASHCNIHIRLGYTGEKKGQVIDSKTNIL